MARANADRGHASGAELIKALLSLVIYLGVMIAVMFGAAGTWDWPRGWLFLGIYLVLTLIACAWLWVVNPEIFAARRKIQKGTKSWDVILTTVIILVFFALMVVPALDDGRFHWAPQPASVLWLGYPLFAVGFMGFAWAQSVNRHFEASVRIQEDRGHQVITTGPYAIVRHPGYAFAILMIAGMPLAMGSLYGLIPAGLLIVLVLIRTLGEDATLKAELPGYREYAQRVKQRWLPGVW
jgi:protein-S-isoprenylcysteine O-methyltransferase Ste14